LMNFFFFCFRIDLGHVWLRIDNDIHDEKGASEQETGDSTM
jgi:hypothetical protein